MAIPLRFIATGEGHVRAENVNGADTTLRSSTDEMVRKKTAISEQRARRRRLKTAILHDIRKGCHGTEAARGHGVSEGTFWQWQYTDASFSKQLKIAREIAVRRIKKAVVAKLRAGKTLKDTAEAVGRTPGTLRHWRKKDAPFDAEVTPLLKEHHKRRNQRRRKRRP